MKKLLLFLAAFSLVFGLAACGNGGDEDGNTLPTISGVSDITVTLGEAFDALDGVTANDEEDGNLTADITVSGTVDVNTAGVYTLTYTVTDSAGDVTTETREVTVEAQTITWDYPDGFYNYKFADTELRHTFMAAAEKYLMNNMYGGVPLFANGGFALYSSRLQLPVEEYVAVMGYGTAFATMSEDDSTVLMDDGELGNAGEYTYRTTISTNPGTFNQWLYDTSTDSTLMSEYYDALYTYVFNADKTGYDVVPSMAAADPVADESSDYTRTTDAGKLVSTKWTVELRDDLEWYYHPDLDTSVLPDGHEVIDATDFIDTFKLALDEEWFRAISGGGDFTNAANEVKGVQDYLDGTGDWDDVGLKVVDDGEDLTLEFEFEVEMSDWNVRYWLSSFVMTPINLELYDYLGQDLGEDETNPYGTSPTTIAMHGPYVLDYYEADKVIRFVKNPNFHTPDLYFFTHKSYAKIDDPDIVFEEFVAGKLESVSLPTSKFEEYQNHPGLKRIPGATTFRIMINALETEAKQRDEFPNSSWIPEPLLANQNFKMGMFHAIDRQKLAEEVLKTSTTNMFLFSDAYLVDAELGIPYRSTEQGESVGEGLSPSTYGYNFDAARAYFELAIDELVAAGTYDAGTADEYNVIEIEFNYFADNTAQVLMFEYLKQAFEDAFVDDENFVKVQLNGNAKDFPGIYYDYMMVGEFDLSIGGISGSTLDAASFLDTYSSDNRGGFTLNWGIDTSQAEIPVTYEDADGNILNEMWSFDAIYSVLNGEIFLLDGEEAIVPNATDFVWTPTSFTFTVDEYDNDDYENIKYVVQTWDNATNAGYIDIPGGATTYGTYEAPLALGTDADTDTEGFQVEVTGLAPGGDYQVTLFFDYVEGDDKSGTYVAPWFYMPTIFSDSDVVATPEEAYIMMTMDENYDSALDYAELWNWDTGVFDAAVEIDNFDDALDLPGLESGTMYVLFFYFVDGYDDYVVINTPTAVADSAVDASFTGAVVELDLFQVIDDKDTEATTDDTVEYESEFDEVELFEVTGYTALGAEITNSLGLYTPAAVTTTDATDDFKVTVPAGELNSNSLYFLQITLLDGNVERVYIETPAIIASSDVEADFESAMVEVELDGDFMGEIATAKLLDGEMTVLNTIASSSGGGFFKSDLATLSIGSLDNDATYYVEYTFDNGEVEYVMVETAALVDAAADVTMHTALVDFDVDADFEGSLDEINLWSVTALGAPDAVLGTLDLTTLAGTDFGPAAIDSLDLEDLDYGTTYALEFVFTGAEAEIFVFATEGLPTVSEEESLEVTETTAALEVAFDGDAVDLDGVSLWTTDAWGDPDVETALTAGTTGTYYAELSDTDGVYGVEVGLEDLMSDTMYIVAVTLSDDDYTYVEYYVVVTDAFVTSADVVTTATTGVATVTLSDNAGTPDVDLVEDDMTTVVTADADATALTGLTAGTTYYLRYDFGTDGVEYVEVTTAVRTIIANTAPAS